MSEAGQRRRRKKPYKQILFQISPKITVEKRRNILGEPGSHSFTSIK